MFLIFFFLSLNIFSQVSVLAVFNGQKLKSRNFSKIIFFRQSETTGYVLVWLSRSIVLIAIYYDINDLHLINNKGDVTSSSSSGVHNSNLMDSQIFCCYNIQGPKYISVDSFKRCFYPTKKVKEQNFVLSGPNKKLPRAICCASLIIIIIIQRGTVCQYQYDDDATRSTFLSH